MMNIRPQKHNEKRSRRSGRSFFGIGARQIRRASVLSGVALSLFLLASPEALSQNEEGAEYPVKLAFLYNFTKFVEWPPGSYPAPHSPFLICIVGHDPFNQTLEAELRTRNVADHPLEVRTLKANDKLNACQIVFVPAPEKQQEDRIVSGLKGISTLTVGESEGFAVLGGIINFTVDANKVHFEVNRVAAERAGLKLSSRLLSIAKLVQEQAQTSKN
jgi:ribosomal protein L16/L10AE